MFSPGSGQVASPNHQANCCCSQKQKEARRGFRRGNNGKICCILIICSPEHAGNRGCIQRPHSNIQLCRIADSREQRIGRDHITRWQAASSIEGIDKSRRVLQSKTEMRVVRGIPCNGVINRWIDHEISTRPTGVADRWYIRRICYAAKRQSGCILVYRGESAHLMSILQNLFQEIYHAP